MVYAQENLVHNIDIDIDHSKDINSETTLKNDLKICPQI